MIDSNVTTLSDNTPWYQGPALLQHLETVKVERARERAGAFRMPVQWVNRPDLDFRGFSGLIASGQIRPGDPIRALPSGKTSRVARIVTLEDDRDLAAAGEAITLTLENEIDCSRGQVIAAAHEPLEVADQFETTLVWMDDHELAPGRAYWLKIGTQTISATVHAPKYEVNVNTQEHLAAKTLDLNAIGVANVTTVREISFASYAESRDLGGFTLFDKMTNRTVAAGMIHFALRRRRTSIGSISISAATITQR